MIKIIDDVLTEKECSDFIQKFKSSKNIEQWRTTFLLNLDKDVTQISQHIIGKPNRIQVVSWPNGSDQNLHFDTAVSSTIYASITYLNEDFEGGQTYFEDGTLIQPKIGRMVTFDGQKYKHGVKEVKGHRYTLPIWYNRI